MKTNTALTKVPKQAVLSVLLIAVACAMFAWPGHAFAEDTSAEEELLGQMILSQDQFAALSGTVEELMAIANNYVSAIQAALNEYASLLNAVAVAMSIFGPLATALLAEWLLRRQTLGAAEMYRDNARSTIITGLVGAIVALLLTVVLACLVVTMPVALGLLFALISMLALSTGFMGASVFKLVFKSLGRYKCALAGGAIMGIACAIPYLGIAVRVVAFIYLAGYVVQNIKSGMKEPDSAEKVTE